MNRIESIILGTPQTNIAFLQLPVQNISFYKLSVPYPCTTDKHVAGMYIPIWNVYPTTYVDIVHQQQPTQHVSHGDEGLIAILYIPARHF